ncbi:RNA polymerase sigma factor [Planctomycetota bacterium]
MTIFNGHTSMGGKNYQFPPTEWTKIHDPVRRESIYSELYTKYWKPLYFYLRGRGFSNEEAKDLVQGFFTDKVLGQELIQKADRTRGRLRNFLLTAVRNYAIIAQRGKRSYQGLDEKSGKPTKISDPETQFNRAWAEELLQEVLRELKTECSRKGKVVHWQLFQEWLLEPDVEATNVRLADIGARHGVTDPSRAYNMISNIKERFRTILWNHLLPLVDSEEEVDTEIADFINIFSQEPTRS